MPEAPHTRPRPTIRDVAALAGTSLKTVSRVVNGEAGVSDELSVRVRSAIDRLGYRHNLTASNLRRSGGKTRSVGMLVSNVANPLDAAVHHTIEEMASQRGVAVMASSLDENPERERQLVEAFAERRVDGLIMMPASHDHSYLVEERRMGMSIVFVDRPPAFFDADAVLVDNREGTNRGVKHLLMHGHRRIAFLSDRRSIVTAAERFRGFADALVAADIPLYPDLVRQDLLGSEHARAAAVDLLSLDQPPTAIFAGQNLVTIGVVRALRSAAKHHEIALVGFDDVPMSDLLDPAITVLAQDPTAIGRQAATTLFARLDGDRSPTQTYIIPTTMITRGSGEIRPPQ
ncbi:MAG: LacI family transcriptional regulator [Actinomycetota bacterium]|nr:LacI family transcriptional regulator [Actinomycetota bacterium]